MDDWRLNVLGETITAQLDQCRNSAKSFKRHSKTSRKKRKQNQNEQGKRSSASNVGIINRAKVGSNESNMASPKSRRLNSMDITERLDTGNLAFTDSDMLDAIAHISATTADFHGGLGAGLPPGVLESIPPIDATAADFPGGLGADLPPGVLESIPPIDAMTTQFPTVNNGAVQADFSTRFEEHRWHDNYARTPTICT